MSYPSTNLPITDIEDTLKYFEQIYDRPVEIGQNVIDALYAFFSKKAANKETALALVHAVIVTSLNARINPMSLLDEFDKSDNEIALDATLAEFLNRSRINTSQLGVIVTPKVNNHISRTILA